MFAYSKFNENKKLLIRGEIGFCDDHKDIFEVNVNGQDIPVYSCYISAMPFNQPYKGYQRPLDQREIAYFVNLISDEDLFFKVKVHKEIKEVHLKPYSANINVTENNNELSFSITKHGQYVIHINDNHTVLFIFNSKEYKEPEETTIKIGPGLHREDFVLKDNDVLYIDKDAYVFGNIKMHDVKNIKVVGNGLLDDGFEERYLPRCPIYCEEGLINNGNISIERSHNIEIEGVCLVNSAAFCINGRHCSDIKISDVKIFGQWRYNSDGMDFMNCHDIYVKDSFVGVFDDCLCVKGTSETDENSYNITFDNLVLMNDWGRACEIGLETDSDEMYNITFKNINIIKCDDVCFDVQNGEKACVHDIKFIDCCVELESYYTPHQLQKSDDDKYIRNNEMNHCHLFDAVNYRLYGSINVTNGETRLDPENEYQATNRNILVENIKVYYDERLGMDNGKFNMPILVDNVIPGKRHKNITLRNIEVNGMKLTKENAQLSLTDVDNFVIE